MEFIFTKKGEKQSRNQILLNLDVFFQSKLLAYKKKLIKIRSNSHKKIVSLRKCFGLSFLSIKNKSSKSCLKVKFTLNLSL